MKTVLLAAPNSYVIRNWIVGGLVDACRQRLGLLPVLVSPFDEKFFVTPRKERIDNRMLEPMLPGWYRRLMVLRAHVFSQEVPAASSQMARMARLRNKYHYAGRVVRHLLPRFSRRRRWTRRLLESASPHFEEVASLLQETDPCLVITGTPGFYPIDLAVMVEAGRQGIPRLCVVNSWDNMTTRGSMICRPERLAVWNPKMHETAVQLHGYPESQTAVVGALQMVPYACPPTPPEVGNLFARLGLAQDAPYLLYVSSQLFQEYEVEEVRLLAKTLEGSRYSNVPLVVRLHPQSDRDTFQSVPNLLLDQAPPFSDRGSGGFSFGFEEVRHLAALLSNAQVVFASVATTAILEAALLDRPSVQLHWTEIPRACSPTQVEEVRGSHRYPHIQFFNQLRCTVFSHSPEDLEATIQRTLCDSRVSERRRQAVDRIIPSPLSHPPARIADLIEGWLSTPRRAG